jgi:hypothetical protein
MYDFQFLDILFLYHCVKDCLVCHNFVSFFSRISTINYQNNNKKKKTSAVTHNLLSFRFLNKYRHIFNDKAHMCVPNKAFPRQNGNK